MAAAFIMLVVPLARAVTPETGMYYDSLRQGLGYYVEVQGDKLVMIAFAYGQQSGEPLFYYASGTITKAKPGISSVFDPPVRLLREDAYQFKAKMYTFDTGPCVTCNVMDWDTSQHAQLAGQVFLRFSDVNRMFVAFQLDDGTTISSFTRRQGFGRQGFDLKSRLIFLNTGPINVPEPLASFRGEWIFTDLEDSSKAPLRYDFDKVVGPLPKDADSPTFGAAWGGDYVNFIDRDKNAVLTCFEYGCGLVVDKETALVMKYWDIGPRTALAYSGFRLSADDEGLGYRGEHLISGIRITDPIPDAPPPPDEQESQP